MHIDGFDSTVNHVELHEIRRITMRAQRLAVFFLIIGLLMTTGAQAALFRVGPNNVPSPPGNGYPFWYQDTLGLALDLCIPETAAQFDACLAPPVPDPALPITFPGNWPDESFWYGADATFDFDAAGTNSALLVQALEAAFAGGAAAVGDQIVFGRIRIRIDAPVDGTYTVTYPYGEQVFPNVTAGTRAINVTSDIGIGAPGDFSGALTSAIGPFLTPVDAAGNPLAPVGIPGAGGVNNDFFLTDGVTPVQVTGSPFGTNFFRVCVDTPGGLDGAGTACMETNLFTVIGKMHQGAIGSPLTLDHATYARSTGSTPHVDVFATAASGPGTAAPSLSFGDAAGTNLMPSTLMNGPTALGQFYGQSIPTSARALPAAVIVTNMADIPPSSVTRSLVDEVTITQASYDPASGTVTITATSSDKGDTGAPAIPPPQLFALGLPGSAGSEPLLPVLGSLDPAEQQILYQIPPILPPGGPVPPFSVTVISSAGGQDSEDVTTVAGAAGLFRAGGPIAVDDSVTFLAGSAASVVIDVLLNDFGFDPATVQIRSQGSNGTAVFNSVTRVITYTFTNNQLLGDDTFTYTVRSAVAPAGLVSNTATVTITTSATAAGPAPIAVNDTGFSLQVNSQLVITAASLTANDNPNGGTLNPASIQIVAGSVTGSSATVAANGNVTFTAGATPGTTFGFRYTVANTNGQRSALPGASVSITVLPATDVLSVASASFRTGTRRWDVTGASTVPGAANTITVVLVRTGAVLGTATPDAAGAWALRVLNSNVIAVNGDQVRATSTAGGSATLAVRVRQ